MAIGVMPALEMAQESEKVISWLKQEGEIVAQGEPLLEVETDKAVMEIESPGEVFSPVASGRKTSAAGSVGRSVCANIDSASRSSRHLELSESAPACGRAAEFASRRRTGDWQSGAVFRLSGAWVVYFAKTPRH